MHVSMNSSNDYAMSHEPPQLYLVSIQMEQLITKQENIKYHSIESSIIPVLTAIFVFANIYFLPVFM